MNQKACIIFLLISLLDMAREASQNALKDCGLSYIDNIDVVVASYCYGEPTSGMLFGSVLYCLMDIMTLDYWH